MRYYPEINLNITFLSFVNLFTNVKQNLYFSVTGIKFSKKLLFCITTFVVKVPEYFIFKVIQLFI